jgi:hypothetical protein
LAYYDEDGDGIFERLEPLGGTIGFEPRIPEWVKSTSALALTGVSGRWIWKSNVRKDKSYTQFRIVIRREGKILRGIYSVDEFVDGRWQGEDGNQTPFIGRVKGNQIEVEFDPLAVQPGYEENVSYVAPSDDRKPSVASIIFSGSNMRWRLITGEGIDGVPANMLLRRERRR